jgi:hypothetical protein
MLPEVEFFFVMLLLEALEVASGNEPHDPAILHQRYVPKPLRPT